MQTFRTWLEDLEPEGDLTVATPEVPPETPIPQPTPAYEPMDEPNIGSARILLYQVVKGLLENIDIKQMGTKSKSAQTINNFQKEIAQFNNLDNDFVDDKHDAGLIMRRIINYTTGSSQQITEIVSLQMVLVASFIDGTLRSIIKQFLKSIANFIPAKAEKEEATEEWSIGDLDEYYKFLRRLVGEASDIDSEIAQLRTYSPKMLDDFIQQVNQLGGTDRFWTHIHDYDPSTDQAGMHKHLLKLALLRMYKSIGSINEDETNAFMKFQVLMIALTARPVMANRLNGTLHQMRDRVTERLNAITPIK